MTRRGVLVLVLTLAGCAPRASRVSVEDLDGRALDPLAGAAGATGVAAFVFVSVDCPISNRYAPELRRIEREYGPRGVAFHLVYPDPAVNAAAIRAHLRAYDLPAAALRDPRHALARRSGVAVTPAAAVYAGGREVYRGRIDDRFASFGRMRPAPTRRELVDALDAALAGRAPAVAAMPAVGCAIQDLP